MTCQRVKVVTTMGASGVVMLAVKPQAGVGELEVLPVAILVLWVL